MNATPHRTKYEINQGSFTTDDGESYTSYGITAFHLANGTKTILKQIEDISTDYNFVNELVSKFNKFDLHIEHFLDVVTDETDT